MATPVAVNVTVDVPVGMQSYMVTGTPFGRPGPVCTRGCCHWDTFPGPQIGRGMRARQPQHPYRRPFGVLGRPMIDRLTGWDERAAHRASQCQVLALIPREPRTSAPPHRSALPQLASNGSKSVMQYGVLPVILKEKLRGTGSGNLTSLEKALNDQAAKGYRLRTITTASSGSKGIGGGDRIQATLVFESLG